MKKLFLVIIGLFAICRFASAQMEITEIMFNPSGSDTGREWVELYNNGDHAVNMSGWKFLENNIKHNLNPISGSYIVNPHEAAVLAQDQSKFLMEYPLFNGKLFLTSFSLTNSNGEEIGLFDKGQNLAVKVKYEAISGEGYSVNYVNNIWVEQKPSPGVAESNVQVPEFNGLGLLLISIFSCAFIFKRKR